MMKLWTIQTVERFHQLQQVGSISGEKEYIEPEDLEDRKWMSDRMEERIGAKPFADCYPICAWKQWDGQKTAR